MNRQFFICVLIFFGLTNAAPVDPKKPVEDKAAAPNNENAGEEMTYNLEYERYLQEVAQLLESDPDFKSKLDSADPSDIKSGKIADQLDFVHHGLRSKLNEIKRRELDRLRDALREQSERENGIRELVIPSHINHQQETFEKEDLRRLVIQATKDLEVLDKKREQDYKEYEMKKELEFRQKLANMTEQERQAAIHQRNETEKKHNRHPDVIHPGSEDQLKDVWQSVDNLPKEEFNPQTFFQLHDLTGDGYLDNGELEALFQKELDKVYDKLNPEDDMRQRDEEMARMRQHVAREWDQNNDGLISRAEFLAGTQKAEFKRDQGWETLEKQKIYTEDDLRAFAESWSRMNGLPVQALYPPYGGYPYPYPQYPAYPMPGQQPYYGAPQYPQQPLPNQQYVYGQYPQGAVPPYQQYPPHPPQQQWPQPQQQNWQQQWPQPGGHPNQQHIPNQQQPQPHQQVDPSLVKQQAPNAQGHQPAPPAQQPAVQQHQAPSQGQVPVAQGQPAQTQDQKPQPADQQIVNQPVGDVKGQATNQSSIPANQGNVDQQQQQLHI